MLAPTASSIEPRRWTTSRLERRSALTVNSGCSSSSTTRRRRCAAASPPPSATDQRDARQRVVVERRASHELLAAAQLDVARPARRGHPGDERAHRAAPEAVELEACVDERRQHADVREAARPAAREDHPERPARQPARESAPRRDRSAPSGTTWCARASTASSSGAISTPATADQHEFAAGQRVLRGAARAGDEQHAVGLARAESTPGLVGARRRGGRTRVRPPPRRRPLRTRPLRAGRRPAPDLGPDAERPRRQLRGEPGRRRHAPRSRRRAPRADRGRHWPGAGASSRASPAAKPGSRSSSAANRSPSSSSSLESRSARTDAERVSPVRIASSPSAAPGPSTRATRDPLSRLDDDLEPARRTTKNCRRLRPPAPPGEHAGCASTASASSAPALRTAEQWHAGAVAVPERPRRAHRDASPHVLISQPLGERAWLAAIRS